MLREFQEEIARLKAQLVNPDGRERRKKSARKSVKKSTNSLDDSMETSSMLSSSASSTIASSPIEDMEHRNELTLHF